MVQEVAAGNQFLTRELDAMRQKIFANKKVMCMVKRIAYLFLAMNIFLSFQAIALTAEQQEAVNLYKSGRYDLAAQKLMIAAKAGDVFSQSLLGTLYMAGQGVPEDKREAIKWNRMAATKGDLVAQYNLAHAYATGQGVIKDDFKAYMWANIAVSGLRSSDTDDVANQLRFFKKVAASALSPKQLEMAQKMSNDCYSNDFKGCN